MRIGVLSDTHIPHRAEGIPKAILDDFKTADMVIHVGDLVDLKVLEQLKGSCANVKAVWGNMDPEEIKQRLPRKEIITAGKYKIGITHGYGEPRRLIEKMEEEFRDDKVDVVIFGHSHKALSEKINNVLYFNPGSATDEVFAPYRSYGILEIN
ncbi:MAG: metallophosphoesterase family protein, partial [Deltaproteobacteria bacterium]